MRQISILCAMTLAMSADVLQAQEQPAYKPLRLVVMTRGAPAASVQESLQYILSQSPHVLVLSDKPLRQRLDAMGLSGALLHEDVSLAAALAEVGAESALLWWVDGDRVIARIFDPRGGVHTITHPLGQSFSHEQARAMLREAFDKVAPSVLQARQDAAGKNVARPLPAASDQAQAAAPASPAPARESAPATNVATLPAADQGLEPGGVIPKRLGAQVMYFVSGPGMRFGTTTDQGSNQNVNSPNSGGELELSLWSDRVAGLYLGAKLVASYQDNLSPEGDEDRLSALILQPQAAARLAFSRLAGVELGLGPQWQDNSFSVSSGELPRSVSRLALRSDLSLVLGPPSWWVLPTLTGSYWRVIDGTYDQWNSIEGGNGFGATIKLRVPLGEVFAISFKAGLNYEQMTVLPPRDEFAWRGQGSLSFINGELGAGLFVSY